MPKSNCSVDACPKPADAKGYCNLHYQRWYRHGDPLAYIAPSRKPCAVEGCDTIARYAGHCVKHFRRVQVHGNPHARLAGGRPVKGDAPSWSAAHKRIHRTLGSASAYWCIDCGQHAQEWSYNNLAPTELVDPDMGIRYALDPRYYEPRCIKCHRGFDAAERRKNSPDAHKRLVLTLTGATDD